ncbi:TonB-dependent receptor [Hymenobacter sp. BT770]|uniref:TonB-dependent receptor plug domain-containing protein n=1 Tax=Hymenobacter sp. BT770 TaxID=2886942 RepID=UPI001D0F8DEA|nr:TonB-dependent receptor [Hymenobacter sp. BT770]MCC3152010.1 TonB-dependent receptor [Hymenobacter sp. BT770]MDO3415307.1 TonB-dependent receptor [Hymenobacter sp. BT770]
MPTPAPAGSAFFVRLAGLLALVLLPELSSAQGLRVLLRDSLRQEPLVGASVAVTGTALGAASDASGAAVLTPAPAPGTRLRITALGFRPRVVAAPAAGATLTLLLAPSAQEIEEEVLVTATRTNSHIEDLPTRVEVLGAEEMEEESSIKPASIASLFGDIAGTQIQPTSPTTGNLDLRLQGLPGQYTQILRDGVPLYGGFAGSFGLLTVPPLDLRQVELIKGSNSTLYGGGAIAGLVNLVSKTPTLDAPQYALSLNQTSLRETDLSSFAARRGRRWGYSAFVGLVKQTEKDIDGDGFVDVPRVRNLNLHPRLFFYPNGHSQLALGYTGTLETRRAGDLQVLKQGPDVATGHLFFVDNTSLRNTADLLYTNESLGGGRLTLKATATDFVRDVGTNADAFTAYQTTYYTEASYLHPAGPRHTLVIGLNVNGEQLASFNRSATPLRSPYRYATVGAFAQDDWQLADRLRLQGGLRLDHHNQFGSFLLPRLALLFKASSAVTARLNGGLGYRAPVPYINSLDERDYPLVQPLRGVRAETSLGLNGDVNYQHTWAGFDEPLVLNVNQSFFYTRLQNPLVLNGAGFSGPYGQNYLTWANATAPLSTRGLETYVRLRADETELYLGYVFTDARRQYELVNQHLPLAARHKFAAMGLVEFTDHFSAGLEASYIGRQYLSNGLTSPGYPLFATLVRYHAGEWTVALNGENVLDYRQTRREKVVQAPFGNPVFSELWAPVEGRVFNVSVAWRLPKS